MMPIQTPPAEVTPAPAAPVRAQYGWGYSGSGGEGTGTLNLLMEPISGRLVAELHGLGERLLLLEGDRATGYHLQVPGRNSISGPPVWRSCRCPSCPRSPVSRPCCACCGSGKGRAFPC